MRKKLTEEWPPLPWATSPFFILKFAFMRVIRGRSIASLR